MPYNPKGFKDVGGTATMAPSELQPPLNFADGGAVNWASDAQVYNTQSQIGNLAATPGGFGGMAAQFTSAPPFGQSGDQSQSQDGAGQGEDQGQSFDFNLGTILQPMPQVPPPPAPTVGSFSSDAYNAVSPPLSGGNMNPPDSMPLDQPTVAMAKGGNVSSLISRLKGEFSKRGLDFDRVMAKRLADQGQKGDTMLAHINPQEAEMLRRAGGSGKINPNTGLPSFSGAEEGGGSQTSSNYGGSPSGGSAEGAAARGGDTPGAGTGGGGTVGGGGGYGGDSNGPAAGGDRGSPDRSNSPIGSVNAGTSPADARAAENASMKAYNDIMATNPTALMSASMQKALADANAANAIAVKNQDVRNAMQTQDQMAILGPRGVDPIAQAMNSPLSSVSTPASSTAQIEAEANRAEAQAQNAIDASTARSGMQTGTPFGDVVTSVVTAANPNAVTPRGEIPSTPAPSNVQIGTGPLSIISQPSPAAARAAENKSMADMVAAMANSPSVKTMAEYGFGEQPASVPLPTPRPADLSRVASVPTGVDLPASTVTSTVPLPVPRPAELDQTTEDPLSSLISKKNLLDTTISLIPGLNIVNAIAKMNGQSLGQLSEQTGQPYTTTQETNDLLNSGIPANVPLPPIPYRDMGEGNILDTVASVFGLGTEQTVAKMAQPYIDQGMTPSEAFTRASYDLRAQQTAPAISNSDKGNIPYYLRPKTPASQQQQQQQQTTPAPVLAPTWSRTYQPVTDYYNYGYGPEGSFYNYAKGGSVGPLSKIRK